MFSFLLGKPVLVTWICVSSLFKHQFSSPARVQECHHLGEAKFEGTTAIYFIIIIIKLMYILLLRFDHLNHICS